MEETKNALDFLGLTHSSGKRFLLVVYYISNQTQKPYFF